MIFVALGANLPGPAGPPLAQCEAALRAMTEAGVTVVRQSPWYETAPVPPSGQPWFVNGVAVVSTSLDPEALLDTLHRIETKLGRTRSVPDAPRTLDLDLLDYDGQVRVGPRPPILPHPRLAERPFVLMPLADMAPDWRHPVSGMSVAALLAALPPGAGIRRRDGLKAENS